MNSNKRTTKQVIAEQQAINRKLWAKENGRLHHVDANKLIAEFMGDSTRLHGLHLQYHTSWDWLMPVVEKIEEDDEVDVNILLNGTRIFKWRTDTDIVNNVAQISFDKKIEHVYDAVVEFIKEHNKYICGSCGDHVNEVVFNEDADVDECTNCTK